MKLLSIYSSNICQKSEEHNTSISEGDYFYFEYGRYALGFLLREIKKKKANDITILIPRFICKDVIDSILLNGIKILFYEVNESLSPVIPDSLLRKVDLLLIVDYFGQSSEIDSFLNKSKEYDYEVIEDAAQSFLSRDDKGRDLGLRGHYGIFSYRKTLTISCGASLFVSKDSGLQIGDDYVINPVLEVRDSKFKLRFLFKFIPPMIILLILKMKRVLKSRNNSEFSKDYEVFSSIRGININVNKEFEKRRDLYIKVKNIVEYYGGEVIEGNLSQKGMPGGVVVKETGHRMCLLRPRLFLSGLELVKWPEFHELSSVNSEEFYGKVSFIPFIW
mgnify:CR=1 FL=1